MTGFDREQEPQDLLRSSGDVLRTVLEGALAAVVLMGADGRIRGWGAQAERTFGWSREEAIGKELAALIVPDELRSRHREGIRRYLETGEGPVLGRVIEMEAIVRSGGRIPVEISINRPVEHGGEPVFIAFVRDISERKTAEEAQRRLYEEAQLANQALRDYSSLMVHELRGPLAVIGGYASMLADGSLFEPPPQVQRAIDDLLRSAEVATGLVERLLMAARIDAGLLTPELALVDVDAAVAAAAERAGPRAALLEGVVKPKPSPSRSAAWADGSWTATILDNLINNALVHSGVAPEVSVEVGAERPTSIWVTDSGRGIPVEASAKIFDRFYRVAGGSEAAGSGLGLYLSHELARMQGGDLVLEPPEEGRGARFRLDLQAPPATGAGLVGNRPG